jgi:hypothetical protein
VYEAVVSGEPKVKVYVKEAGLQPDELAAELLREVKQIIPKIRNICIEPEDKELIEYGVMQNIADVDGVKNIVSLRGLARNKYMSELVLKRFDEFCFVLGHAFEVCRMLGIQDRTARNMYVVEKTDGSLAIGEIDLDLVACYPEMDYSVFSYGGQLTDVVTALDFAIVHGPLLRTQPEMLGKVMMDDEPESRMIRRHGLVNRVREKFFEGVMDAREFFADNENAIKIHEKLCSHQGKPVGLAMTDAEMNAREDDIKPRINGRVQSLIQIGPNQGRFLLQCSEAWRHGFLEQAGEDPIAFWRPSLVHAIQGVGGTVIY